MKKRTGTSSVITFVKIVSLVGFLLRTIGRTTYLPFVIIIQTALILFRFLLKLRVSLFKLPKLFFPLPPSKKKKRKKLTVIYKKKSSFAKWAKKLAYLFFILVIVSAGILWFYVWILKDLPTPEKLLTQPPLLTTKIYDRDNRLLYKIYRDQNRTLVPLNKIPPYFINATLAIEDKNFYKHNGLAVEGLTRALKRNIFNQQLEGGSTITQQLIKNTLLTSEKTLRRKIKELVLSFQTELIFDKNQILEMYLNTVPYGGTAYGAEEAAQTYFAKSVSDLSLAESALLAGLPAAPSKYSPFGPNPELSVVRQHEVLRRMVEDGYINPFEAESAKAQKILLAPLKNSILAPHFVMYLKDWLAQKYGLRQVEQGGLTAISSLDLELQNLSQTVLTEELDKLKNMNVTNGAVLITKPASGEILAMVGSKNYFDSSIDGNVNVVLQSRQPGSTIKIANYAYALAHGYTAASIISDTPISYRIPGQPTYQPVNYDQHYHGNVTLRQALACSYNIPAVKVLASFGVDKMIAQGQKMGITTWDQPERYGLSLTLGGGEVKMIDLATAYGVLANEGKKVSLNPSLLITDYQKQILDQNGCHEGLVKTNTSNVCLARDKNQAEFCPSESVIDPAVAFILTSIMSDNEARTSAFGPNSLLNIKGNQVAVKTGTTNDKRDNWCIGYTQDYLVAVWVGNNNNEPMSNVASGITGATPIWNRIMSELIKNSIPNTFEPPMGVIKVPICQLNGLRACGGCPSKDEFFIKGTEPKYACNSEEVKRMLEEKERLKQNQILEGISTTD